MFLRLFLIAFIANVFATTNINAMHPFDDDDDYVPPTQGHKRHLDDDDDGDEQNIRRPTKRLRSHSHRDTAKAFERGTDYLDLPDELQIHVLWLAVFDGASVNLKDFFIYGNISKHTFEQITGFAINGKNYKKSPIFSSCICSRPAVQQLIKSHLKRKSDFTEMDQYLMYGAPRLSLKVTLFEKTFLEKELSVKGQFDTKKFGDEFSQFANRIDDTTIKSITFDRTQGPRMRTP